MTAATLAERRKRRPRELAAAAGECNTADDSCAGNPTASPAFPDSSPASRSGGRERKPRGALLSPAATTRRLLLFACCFVLYGAAYHRLGELEEFELQQRLRTEGQHQQNQQQQQRPTKIAGGSGPGLEASPTLRTVGVRAKSISLGDYFRTNEKHKTDRTSDGDGDGDGDGVHSPGPSTIAITMEEARRGREPLLAILEDAGIDIFDPNDVLRLPMWSSVSDLYYGTGSTGAGSTGSSRTGSDHLPEPNRSVAGGTERPGASVSGPVILGLERCAGFRERVPLEDRYLGVAGNFNSGTTAFGIALQKNCRLEADNGESNIQRRPLNWSHRGKRGTVVSNVNGMLSEVPWAKHKPASYYRRHNGKRNTTTTTTKPTVPQSSVMAASAAATAEPIVDHDSVLPVVLVRDPFYWMQSMCREGYGVRWDHDAKRHCPNLVPDASDRAREARKQARKQRRGEDDALRLSSSTSTSSVPVWMGANPTEGPTWPSLIHYWNDWYESYYNHHDLEYSGNDDSGRAQDESVEGSEQRTPKPDRNRPGSNWPRLIVRFEDTLFYPSEVMAKVCHCGGGRLIGEPSSGNGSGNSGGYEQQIRHDYSLEDSKPRHRHEGKSNFVQAMVRYGTNATRFHNMTREDIRFAVEHLNPELMEAFGYSYPSKEYYE